MCLLSRGRSSHTSRGWRCSSAKAFRRMGEASGKRHLLFSYLVKVGECMSGEMRERGARLEWSVGNV